MRLGIDIDDVVTETAPTTIEYVAKYEHLLCDNREISSNLRQLFRGHLINEPLKQFIKEYAGDLWGNIPLRAHAYEVLTRLHNQGHTLIFITSRNDQTYSGAVALTYDYFARYNLPYDKIIFSTHDKRQVCLDEAIDVFIDDSVDSCNDVFENTRIKVFLFNSIINQDFDCKAPRLHSWLELERELTDSTI